MSAAHIHDWDTPLPFNVHDPGLAPLPLVQVVEPDPDLRNIYVVKCPSGGHRCGLIAHQGHLVYRTHAIQGATGHSRTCSASLRPIHELPPPTRPDIACHPKGNHP